MHCPPQKTKLGSGRAPENDLNESGDIAASSLDGADEDVELKSADFSVDLAKLRED